MRRAESGLLSGVLFTSFLILTIGNASAALPDCDPVVGELTSVEGDVRVQRAGGGSWEAAGLGIELCDKDTVRTEANSRAAVSLINDAVFRIDQNTAVHLADIAPEPEEKSFVQLLVGAIQSFSRKPREVAIDTPYLNATIEGTEFVIRVAQNETQLTVFEGTVRAANPQGEEAVTSGQMVVAQAGQAPQRRVVVRPRDAAQWSIYYPPVLAAQGGAAAPADLPPAMAEAAALAGQGDAAGALTAMDRVPAGQQDARYHLYRASFLLAAGQVGQARGAIDRALQADSGSALAYAMRAVIDVAQNRKDDGLANGQRAVELDPDSAAAAIALSYALQADYQLGEARQTLERAVAANPDDALAHARLAELWMMVGYRDRAREEAEKAVDLAPNLERAQVVLGFANLVEIRTGQAKAAFSKALSIDSDDPMAHLGLGLAMIREGDLADGRKHIEAAVALDPESALLRSYLGKAYFEEKRKEIDAQQLAMAKEFDPNDPTAYLYDALRKQSENRPVEALRDLQKSIELNDNRAVYRGRLQLDEDRAARGASLANVYSDLGFDQLGLREAMKSLNNDPTNASAHRFLSDSYRSAERREIARVSEQLQSQMLQDININPVSPSGSVANLNVTGGTAAGFNEYTALFERNQLQLDVGGMYGSDETWSGEAIASGVYDWLSVSAGAYHYETDGWRENSTAEHEIYNVYAQAALTPELNLQLEYRTRDTEYGDLATDFDPTILQSDLERRLDQDIARAGVRYSPSPNSDILFSYIYSERTDWVQTIFGELGGGCPFPDPLYPNCPVHEPDSVEDDGYQAETQYLFRTDQFNFTLGAAYSNVDRTRADDFVIYRDSGVSHAVGYPVFSYDEIEHSHAYVYNNISLPASVTMSVGLSYDRFSRTAQEVEEFNPKIGVQWNLSDNLRLRGVWLKAVKPALVNNRTLEPTQVAGFNQIFDDPNATVSRRYGGALDWDVTDSVFAGVEGTWRNLTLAPLVAGVPVNEDRDEQTHRAYLYWTPGSKWALSAEIVYDWLKTEDGILTSLGANPLEMETISVPLGLRYFDENGLFAGVGATFVHQDVDRLPAYSVIAGTDDFTVVDAAVGWRLPSRRGTVSLEAKNLLGQDFKYQDNHFREFGDEPSVGPYAYERTILGRLNLKF